MDNLDRVRDQLHRAADLPDVLHAAYACFTAMLPVIEYQQDPNNPLFVPFVMAGASAASGRFALVAAPSLPNPARAMDGEPRQDAEVSAADAALVLGGLAQVLENRLRDATLIAVHAADRQACAEAARHASDLSARFGRTPQS